MAKSQNGWSVVTSSSLVNLRDANGWRIPVRKGDVAVVFEELINWFHKDIEKLRNGWSWGWAPRKIRGSSSISNHASGTAVDLNAPLHPLGKRNTFSSAQQKKIRAKAKALGLRWGGDYKSRADDMHFEVNVSAAKLKQIAAKLKGKPVSLGSNKKTNAVSYPLIVRGQKNNNVKRLQRILNAWYPSRKIAVDGIFGSATEKLVRYMQGRAGLVVDGKAGKNTLKALNW